MDPKFLVLPALLVCAVLVSLVSKKIPKDRDKAIQALFTILVPTRVAWPHEYMHLVDHSVSARSKTVTVSMTSFIDAICSGKIEIRNSADLPKLFSDKLNAHGWRVRFGLDSSWSWVVVAWVVGKHFSWQVKPTPRRRALKRAHGVSEPKESITPLSLTPNSCLHLDYIPLAQLEPSLVQLRATLPAGTSATLEFTTSAAHLSFLSPQFTISAVPFLPRKRVGRSGVARTATPLFASIHRILELLTAGPAALALESVSNESIKYANALNAAATQLEQDPAARSAFIQQWKEEGWRERRLMLVWEAALFSAGHLMRWVVVVRR
ncbi:hypothetical protein FB45DRAFT_866459 [Roridomyces roridus]|uniref:Uncharacterized protein n=1 Tax=Roridomyces roridus TaxID=1738132 RepID=A0AAD7FQ92_9AGAR|nr:hypothetical protein FB45DRAFT_866459 [Roridomyces roridus]